MVCELPIIFLDTSILIKSHRSISPYKELVALVKHLVKNKKIIALEGAQRDEISRGRDFDGINALNDFCCATRSFPCIQSSQVRHAIKKYQENDSSPMQLKWEDIFLENPALSSFRMSSGIGRTELDSKEKELSRSSLNYYAELQEELRRFCANSEIEFKHIREANLRVLIQEWKYNPFFAYYLWEESEMFTSFLESDFFKEIPHIYLDSYLKALIISNKGRKIFDENTRQPIKGRMGDYIDLLNISTLLPYCNFFTVDSNMKDMLRQATEGNKDKGAAYIERTFSSSKVDIKKLIISLKKLE